LKFCAIKWLDENAEPPEPRYCAQYGNKPTGGKAIVPCEVQLSTWMHFECWDARTTARDKYATIKLVNQSAPI